MVRLRKNIHAATMAGSLMDWMVICGKDNITRHSWYGLHPSALLINIPATGIVRSSGLWNLATFEKWEKR
jgi:hypothetical protein